MTGVLVALAVATVFVGHLGAPQFGAVFGQWVFFEEIEAEPFVLWIAAISVTAAVLGILAGWALYRRYREPDPLRRLGGAYTLLANKYYLDDAYWRGIVRPTRDTLSAAVYWTNQKILDAIVNGAARATMVLGRAVNGFDRSVIDRAVNGVANTAGVTGGFLRYLQSGNVQRYAAFLFTGVVVLAIIFTRI
jgi:NADH-quinone oxidoreductase subunit L